MTYKEFKLRMEVLHETQDKINTHKKANDTRNKDSMSRSLALVSTGLDRAINVVQSQKEGLCSRVPREFVSAYAKERVKS